MAPKTVKPLRWPFNADYMFLEAEKNNEKKRVAETLRWALILKDGPSATLKKLVNEGVMPEDPRFYGLTKKTGQQLVKALKDYKLLEQELETQEYSGYSSSLDEDSTSVKVPVKAGPSSTKDKESSKPVPQPSKSDDPKSDDSNDSDYVAGSDVASDYDDYEEEDDEDDQSGESDANSEANSDRMSVDAESSSEPPAKKKRT